MKSKVCPKCGHDRDVEDFAWRNKSMGRRQSWCKACHREIDSDSYYNRGRDKQVRERTKRVRTEAKDVIDSYKMGVGCQSCGYNEYVAALDLHHVEGTKTDNIATMIIRCFNIERIWEEVGKCEVLCANCHRIHHAPLSTTG